MNKFYRTTAFLVSLFMAITVATGCTNRNKKEENQKNAQDTSPTTTNEAPYKFKIFFPVGSPYDEQAEKPWYDYVSKASNVQIELEVPPQSSANERLQIVLAGGDYPDVIRIVDMNAATTNSAVNNGTFIPITQYVKNASNLQKYTYPMSWDALKLKKDSDDIYGVPVTTVIRYDGFDVRKDWADSLGIKLPSDYIMTLDEFTDVLQKFTKNDPDKNGKNDTYGLGTQQDANGNLLPFVTEPFGVLGWQEYGGKYQYMDLKYSKEHSNYKQALEYSAMLFKEGFVDPNAPVSKSAQSAERHLQGITGIKKSFPGFLPTSEADMKKVNPNAKLSYIVGIKDKDGNVKGTGLGNGLWGMWAITKSAIQPGKIVEFFDSLLSDELWTNNYMGVEGVHFKKENGKLVKTDLAGRLKNNALVRRKENVDLWVNPLSTPEEWMDVQKKWIEKSISVVIPSKDQGYIPPIFKEPKLIDAGKKLDVTITKIIVGASPLSEYDKALDDWYKAGGEEYIKQMNDYIKKVQGK